jgi:hypothetical protein
LERRLEKDVQEPFRGQLLLKKYMSFGNAKVIGLSLARYFNQICEILMHCDLEALRLRQRKEFVVNNFIPIWENAMQG